SLRTPRWALLLRVSVHMSLQVVVKGPAINLSIDTESLLSVARRVGRRKSLSCGVQVSTSGLSQASIKRPRRTFFSDLRSFGSALISRRENISLVRKKFMSRRPAAYHCKHPFAFGK